MTVYSQNGWSANDRTRIASYTIPGTSERVALRKGDPSVVLLDVAGFVNTEIIDLQQKTLDEWGYAERPIRGSTTTLSNHASGTALDVDARKHPLRKTGTWTAAQKAKIHARLELYDGVVRWGEDYHGRTDGMHFEINAGAAAVAKVADKVRAGRLGHGAKSYLVGRAPFADSEPAPKPKPGGDVILDRLPTLREGSKEEFHVRTLQALLSARGGNVTIDGDFGPVTLARVRDEQHEHGLKMTGTVDDNTWTALITGHHFA